MPSSPRLPPKRHDDRGAETNAICCQAVAPRKKVNMLMESSCARSEMSDRVIKLLTAETSTANRRHTARHSDMDDVLLPRGNFTFEKLEEWPNARDAHSMAVQREPTNRTSTNREEDPHQITFEASHVNGPHKCT